VKLRGILKNSRERITIALAPYLGELKTRVREGALGHEKGKKRVTLGRGRPGGNKGAWSQSLMVLRRAQLASEWRKENTDEKLREGKISKRRR